MKEINIYAPDFPTSCKRLTAAESIGRKDMMPYKKETANNDKLVTSLSITKARMKGIVPIQKLKNQKYQYSLLEAFPSNLAYFEKQFFIAFSRVISLEGYSICLLSFSACVFSPPNNTPSQL